MKYFFLSLISLCLLSCELKVDKQSEEVFPKVSKDTVKLVANLEAKVSCLGIADLKEGEFELPLKLVACLLGDDFSDIYVSSILSEIKRYQNFTTLLFYVSCTAGAECKDYFLVTVDAENKVIDHQLVFKEHAEGEDNSMLDAYNLSKNSLTLDSSHDYYDNLMEAYVNEKTNISFVIDKAGFIAKEE